MNPFHQGICTFRRFSFFFLSLMLAVSTFGQGNNTNYLFFPTSISTNEGAGSIQFFVRRTTGTNSANSIQLEVRSSTNGVLVGFTNILEFQEGELERAIEIPLIDNDVTEPDQLLTFTLRGVNGTTPTPQGRTLQLRIINDDAKDAILTFDPRNFSVLENQGTFGIQVVRTGRTNILSTVDLIIARNFSSSQIQAQTNSLVFAPGETNLIATFDVQDNFSPANSLPFSYSLKNPSAGTILTNATGTITLLNDDASLAIPGTITLPAGISELELSIGRSFGLDVTHEINYQTYGVTAGAGVDFISTNGTLRFEPGETSKSLTLNFLENSPDDKIRSLALLWSGASSNALPSTLITRIHLITGTNAGNSGIQTNFLAGTNAVKVLALAVQPDGKLLVGGGFTNFQNNAVTNIARLNLDGTIDTAFTTTVNVKSVINAIAVTSSNTIWIGGTFTNVNGTGQRYFAQLEADGSLSENQPLILTNGTAVSGFLPGEEDFYVWGLFKEANSIPATNLIRILPGAVLDTNFSNSKPSAFTTVQRQGTNLIVMNGSTVSRLLPDGSADSSFLDHSGSGLWILGDLSLLHTGSIRQFSSGYQDTSFSMENYTPAARLRDGRIIAFSKKFGTSGYTEVVLLFADGSLDSSFAPVILNNSVQTISQMGDLLYLGGDFTLVEGEQRTGIALVTIEPSTGPAEVHFNGTRFSVEEREGGLVPLFRTGNTNDVIEITINAVLESAAENDLAGTNFMITFAPGQVEALLPLPLTNDSDPEEDEQFQLSIETVSGASIGVNSNATITIISDEGFIEFTTNRISVLEGIMDFALPIVRKGALPYPLTADLHLDLGTNLTTNEIAIGQPLMGPFQIRFLDDSEVEPLESLTVTLTNLSTNLFLRPGGETLFVELESNDFTDFPGESFRFSPLFPQSPTFAAVNPLPDNAHFNFSAPDRNGLPTTNTTLLSDGSLSGEILPEHLAGYFPGRVLPDKKVIWIKYSSESPDRYTIRPIRTSADYQLDLSYPTNLVFTNVHSWNVSPLGILTVFESKSFGSRSNLTHVVSSNGTTRQFEGGFSNNTGIRMTSQSDGKIIVAPDPLSSLKSVTRYLTNGAVDRTFQPNIRALASGSSSLLYTSLLMLPDDRFYILGNFDNVAGQPRPGFARFLPDGQLDTSFNPQLPLTILGTNQSLHLEYLFPDGKLLMRLGPHGGLFSDTTNLLFRSNSDGSVDPSWNTNLWTLNSVIYVAQLKSGILALSGWFTQIRGEWRAGFALLDPNGNLLPEVPLIVRNTEYNGSEIILQIDSRTNGEIIVEATENLEEWFPIQTNSVPFGSSSITVPQQPDRHQVLRLRRPDQ
ncbi:MAG: Calx-beta domain-containing protein [Verrucomicrobiota bacterium]|nr:Calx-beta domain-containing protein [Verrucomicrobiota bacterium]